MPCDNRLLVIKRGSIVKGKLYNEDILVPCGKCYNCKKRRIDTWVFRLQKEEETSFSSYFVTLTYGNENLPISQNGLPTLDIRDLQKFFKRLRKYEKGNNNIKYYAAGEYGSKRKRPHYHIILFNVKNIENIYKAWTTKEFYGIKTEERGFIGEVHIGNVSNDSIAYTAKYIDKPTRIPMFSGDDRAKEFSTMSNGLGSNYLTPEIYKYHHERLNQLFIEKEGGYNIALPSYYRNLLFNEDEKKCQREHVRNSINVKENINRTRAERDGVNYDLLKDFGKRARALKLKDNRNVD